MADNWTEKQVQTLLEMTLIGCTARQIGDKIGKGRNAILGKIHRLKLPHRGNGQLKKTASIPIKSAMPPLVDGCQWDCGGRWCGEITAVGLPYCHAHCDQAYLKPKPNLGVDALVRLSHKR